MATADVAPNDTTTTRQRAWKWAETQGAATVLLFVIALGVWRAAPYVLAEVKGMIADFRAELKEQRADHRANEDANRKVFLEANQKLDDRLDELTNALQARQP